MKLNVSEERFQRRRMKNRPRKLKTNTTLPHKTQVEKADKKKNRERMQNKNLKLFSLMEEPLEMQRS